MKLWDKGYDIDRFTEEFTIGKDRELDVMLAKADVLGNMAHLKMLHHIGLISDGELKDLAQGLKDIFALFPDASMPNVLPKAIQPSLTMHIHPML